MYVLIVDYLKTETEVALVRAAHGLWIKQHIDAGLFLLAGPKHNQQGGVILAQSTDEKKLKAILAEDPYVAENVAAYQVIAFEAKTTRAELAFLQGQ